MNQNFYVYKHRVLNRLLLVLALVANTLVFGQDTLQYPVEPTFDPTQTKDRSFDLGDPSAVKQTIVYDPKTGTYVFKETIGSSDMNYRNPSMMTLEEYLDYERKKSQTSNWKEKIDEQTAENRPFELPIKIGSKLFENIFGSDQITIRPAGSVSLSFGINSSRYDNPILPVKQRKITRFDFQQQIQLNLVGQIGTKLKIGTSYNTQAAFDFDNISKLEYTGNEDQILQKIALGNVSMPLPTSLIQGSQTLFGVQTQLKFGRATVDLIAASSKGKKQEINIAGKSQVQTFQMGADNYEANRHYFLAHYHHDHYDEAMATLPIVNSGVSITRMEVWLTNKTNNTENTRNIIAFTDLGEAKAANCQGNPAAFASADLPDNNANGLYKWAADAVANPEIRGFSNAVSALTMQVNAPGPFTQATHYEKVQNARKLSDSEFSYNALLGFISLNLPLNNDEVLGVAYEYTYKGQTYTVGELSTDGIPGQSALIVKLLKPTITNPKNKVWDLMMKNVYSIGAYQVGQQGFRLNFLYNNPATSLMVPFFPYPGVDDKLLVEMLDMDKINQNNQPFSDGVFDFAPISYNGNRAENGGTINTKNGRVYFSTVEPFGKTLKSKLTAAGVSDVIVNQVAYTELYDSTKTAAQQIPSKNRFSFQGEYQSTVSSDIPLNALNVPEGAVSVTAGGIKLTEGTDYTVDYNLGRVKILNTGILESNTPIKISIESNSVFGFQSRSLVGARYNYRFSQNLNVGGTWMRMMERPVTQKVDIGTEPYKNNLIGFDLAYKTELPFLTKMVDLLPVISTKEKSTLSFTGEFAHLIPGTPKAINKDGTSYIDDFEGAQSTIDLKTANSWRLASIPQGQSTLFPEASSKELYAGFKRSRLSWYTIDQLFYASNNLTPQHIKDNPDMLSDSRMRLIQTTDLFPNTQLAYGTPSPLQTLDLAFYPKERGMYNYDTTAIDQKGLFTNPENRWGGIMRALTTNDFEQTNIQYIQFWILDPFNEDAEKQNPSTLHTGGDLYFNLGNISEDVLPDSYKSFENGLPPTGVSIQDDLDTTKWARVSSQQPVVNAFDTDNTTRQNQDVGLDGWNNEDEKAAYTNFVKWVQNSGVLADSAKNAILADPSSDDFNYYRDDDYDGSKFDILQRYKKFNGMEGNSPTESMSQSQNAEGYMTLGTNSPDIEDINQDNNLAESESYFQYKISLRKNDLDVGKNFITSKQTIDVGSGTTAKKETWYQFKVPLLDYEKKVNEIQDFRSIRFMRMFLKGFDEEVVVRFARLELIRGEWRKYANDLTQPGDGINPEPNATSFNIGTVNIEENDQREPIKYEIPPGIVRQTDPSQAVQRQMNEQSLAMDICNLKDGDARATYKNVQFDVRTYKKLKMFVHAEEVSAAMPYTDEDLTLFVRLGSDFTDNYYEYEFPLYKTAHGASLPEDIWPEANDMEIIFEDLLKLKKDRNDAISKGSTTASYVVEYSGIDPQNPKRMIRVKGSPNLQGIKTIMVGVRNPAKNQINPWPASGIDDGAPECVIVWINELRLTDFISEGGSAAVAQAQVQAADFGTFKMSGNYSGLNWGGVESRVQERQRNEKIGLDMNTNVQLGQFFGKQARISLPFFYGHSLSLINPEYDPFNPDIRLKDYDLETRRERAQLGQDLTERKSYNFTNVRKEAAAGSTPHLWKISNWSVNYAYSENLRKDFNTKYDRTKTWNGGLNYNYSFNVKPFEPFKNVKFMAKSPWWKIVKDMNVFLLPKNISFTNDLMRSYNERQIRNNLVPDFNFTPVYVKQFTWRRQYNLGYDITKNLKFDFSATNSSIFEEGQGQVDRKNNPENYRIFKDSIFSQMQHGGKTMTYTHNYNLSYNIPLEKIPVFNWMTANVKYGGTYEWQRAPLGQTDFGNTIQNSRNVNMTGQMNFTTLYNKVPYLKKVNSDGRNQRGSTSAKSMKNDKTDGSKKDDLKKEITPPVDEKPESEMTEKEKRIKKRKEKRAKRKEEREERRKGKVDPLGGFLARMLMTVRNVSGTYAMTDGTLLPGFNQESNFLGMQNGYNSQLSSFVFGKQGYDLTGRPNGYDVATLAAQNTTIPGTSSQNWLVRNEDLNKAHTITHNQNFNLRASLEPIKDVTIEMNLKRTYANNSSDFYRWIFDDPNNTNPTDPGQFSAQSRVQTASLSYTTISVGTAFAATNKKNEYSSTTFKDLLENRTLVSEELGAKNTASSKLNSGYYDGYDGSQQEVVLGAFLTAYTNSSIDSKNTNPLKSLAKPNWSVNYNGLTKMHFMSKIAKNFVVRHAYSSTVAVSGIQTNLKANEAGTARDINGNFEANDIIQNVTISERFSPLIGFDATWNMGKQGLITKFEIKKDRNATLSLNNNQVTEILGTEYVFGTGYKFNKVKLPFEKIPASPVNVRFDVSIRDNLTVIRKIIENSNQATAGQKVVSIKSSADYNVSQNIVIQFYYDQVITNPKIATAYPTGNLSCGLRLQFNLAGVQ